MMKTFLLSLLLLFPLPLHFISLNSALPRTTPTTLRSSSDIYNLDLPEVNNCVPNTSGKTFQVVAPIQMNAELDGNFQLSYGQFLSTNIYCDTINTGSCGVTADVGEGAEILPFEVLGIADDKSKAKAADIVTVQSEINFNKSQPFGFMGPYSSGIAKGLVEGATGPLVTVNKLGIFPGSSSPSIFANNNVSYGMLIPSTQFLDVVFDVYGNGTNNNNEFDGLGLKNVSYVYDTKILTSGICNTIRDGQDGSPGRATSNNMKYVESWPLSESEFSNETKMDEITQQIKDSAVELVVFCTYESGCEAMVDMFHRNKYYPKASSFIICAGLKSFEDYAGSKLMDMTGVALWTPVIFSSRTSVLAALLASASTAAAFSMQMNYKHRYGGFNQQSWPTSFSDTLGGKGPVPSSEASAVTATSDLPPAKASTTSASSLSSDLLNIVGDPYPPQPAVTLSTPEACYTVPGQKRLKE